MSTHLECKIYDITDYLQMQVTKYCYCVVVAKHMSGIGSTLQGLQCKLCFYFLIAAIER